jgi:hypothetical protein
MSTLYKLALTALFTVSIVGSLDRPVLSAGGWGVSQASIRPKSSAEAMVSLCGLALLTVLIWCDRD